MGIAAQRTLHAIMSQRLCLLFRHRTQTCITAGQQPRISWDICTTTTCAPFAVLQLDSLRAPVLLAYPGCNTYVSVQARRALCVEATARLAQAGEQPGRSASGHMKLLKATELSCMDVQDRAVAMAFQLLQAMWNKDYQASPGAAQFVVRQSVCCACPAIHCLAPQC